MANHRNHIRFYLNDAFVELTAVPHQQTVLDFLRLDRCLSGTKEGCAEGDCGACTVLVGRLGAGDVLVYEPVNACIRMTATLDGTHLVTIEHLGREERLHPVQQAMVDHHGSQCGFCTPGIVMSLYRQWLSGADASVGAVERSLQGNLCRCTGYAPIVRAAQAVNRYGALADDPLVVGADAMASKLRALHDDARVTIETPEGVSILPADVDDLARILNESPDGIIVSGSTDVGLWVTKLLQQMPRLVFLSRVSELREIAVVDGRLVLGGAATYADAEVAIRRHIPQLQNLWTRIGGEQVRSAGTIGGNIANGSPIGDTPPALIALGAEIVLRHGKACRTLPLEDFFVAYGRQDRAPGEFIQSISVPLPHSDERYAVYKVSKRFDEDISAVLGAFRVRLVESRVSDVTIAYGGMAGTPKRARAVEHLLLGKAWTRATVEAAMAGYEADFKPLSDWRASAGYRMAVARNLLLRFWTETTGLATGARELTDA